MVELTPNQIVDALRKCAHTDVCDGCPYRGVPCCEHQLLSDAAAVIEALQAIFD